MFNLRETDLQKLNSLTKYPSIPTYHGMGERGVLTDERIAFSGPVVVTEKIDGTNARILVLPDGNYVLGSREELLYAKGDLIGNPALGIVNVLKPLAENLLPLLENEKLDWSARIVVLYGEVYGGKVTAASRQYTSDQSTGFRFFDIAVVPNYEELLEKTAKEIASWRDNGNQFFYNELTLGYYAGLCGIPFVPRPLLLDASNLPASHQDTLAFFAGHLPPHRRRP